MQRLEELLLTRQYYKTRITEVNSSVVHNKATKKQVKYFERRISELEQQIVKELDNDL